MSLRRGRFIGRRLLRIFAIGILVLGGGAWFLARALDKVESERLEAEMRAQVAIIAEAAKGNLSAEGVQRLRPLAHAISNVAGDVRLTFLDSRGDVLLDSSTDPARMENHFGRPEIQQARIEGWGTSTRWSTSVSRDMWYVAARVGGADRPEGYVRAALSWQSVADHRRGMRRLVWTTFAATALSAILLVVGLTLAWERRLVRFGLLARSLSRGDLTSSDSITGSDELVLLGRALHRMRDRVATQVASVERHRRTLESLVEQVRDGVVVADARGRVVIMNAAARSLLNPVSSSPERVDFRAGLHLEQVIPQHEFQRLLAIVDVATTPSERGSAVERQDEVRIELDGGPATVTVLARASDVLLPATPTNADADVEPTRGRMLILTDISELVRALKVRSDFVTNASHEMRTPVAAIRGAVETLLTLDFSRDASAARRFVEMIERHSGRLESLAADLLELSRIESGGGRFSASSLSVARLSADLHARWRDSLEAGGLFWSCQGVDACPTVRANAHLVDLVLDNLVDNAIKFTQPGGKIGVAWRRAPGWIEVEVSDTGCGIPTEDQERVFERFYQVATARSEIGSRDGVRRGTGLGLSIVRHAAAALGGAVFLRSVLGSGTTVTLRISQVESTTSLPNAPDGGPGNFTPT